MLKDIQQKFSDAIMKNEKSPFLSEIEEGGRIGPEKRLHIYAHAYKARLVEVLVEDFPGLHSLVGDEMFEEICLGYIDKYPSKHPSLRYLGQHMAKFLKEEDKYKKLIPAIEMAEFEWTLNDVFDAPDGRNVTVEDVTKIPPEAWTTLRILLQPSFRHHMFKWNTAAVWQSVSKDDENPTMPEEFSMLVPCIQWKTDLKCFFRTLSEEELEVLKLVKSNKAFPEVCELLAPTYKDQAPTRAAELFYGWVTEGLVTDMEYLKS